MTNLRTDLEYIIHCEEDGTIIGPISKHHAHLPGPRTALTHYSTRSMVYNLQLKKYGLQRRSHAKSSEFSGGKRSMGVAGHNCYINEKGQWRVVGFDENLTKEAHEEIGMELSMYSDIKKFITSAKDLGNTSIGHIFEEFHFQSPRNNERIGLGVIFTNQEKFQYIDNEVIDFKWVSEDQLKDFFSAELEFSESINSLSKTQEITGYFMNRELPCSSI